MQDYNDEIEIGILSCLLTKNKLFDELMLEPKHFIKYRKIIEFLLKCKKKYEVLDSNLLCFDEECPKEMTFEFISELITLLPTTSVFHDYQQRQFDIYKNYNLHLLANQYTTSKITEEEFIEQVESLSKETISLKLTKNENEIYELITSSNKMIQFSRLHNLSSKVQFMENTFNIIAARPSVGKSAFALNLMEDLSMTYNCLYFNMEMTEREIYERLVAIQSGINMDYFTNIQSEHQRNCIKSSISEILKRKIKIINGSKSIETIRKIILSEQRHGHTIVFIDYVGYVNGPKKQNDREKIGDIVRQLQLLTKDYNITIFCLAQINREGVEEPSKENLKDSGELEQSGHAVILLHNMSKEPLNDLNPKMKIIIAKNRSGRTGYLIMNYCKKNQKFSEEKQFF